MALWRVLDLYKRDASRRGQAPAKPTLWTRIKRSTLKPERNGAFAAKPLGESPRSSSRGGIFEFCAFYIFRVFSVAFCFGRRFSCAVLFYCRKNHFSVLFEYDFTPWKRQKSTQNCYTVFHSKHLFLSIEKAERLNARLILLFAVQIDFYAEIFVRKE